MREGDLSNVDDPEVRRQFEQEYCDLLDELGMEHFDISEVRGRNRIVTQKFSRFLFDREAAGIVFRSNLDALPCVALFEGRASVTLVGSPETLERSDELLEVCREFGLVAPVFP